MSLAAAASTAAAAVIVTVSSVFHFVSFSYPRNAIQRQLHLSFISQLVLGHY